MRLAQRKSIFAGNLSISRFSKCCLAAVVLLLYAVSSRHVTKITEEDSTIHHNRHLRKEEAAHLVRIPGEDKNRSFDSNSYWEKRYASGSNSGAGSYGDLAAYKAKIINEFVTQRSVQEVAEFGCGDGNNLRLYDKIPRYVGYDVSSTVIEARRKEWEGKDSSRTFFHLNGKPGEVSEKYDATMSLDVLYHLVDVEVFISYLETLFLSAKRFVLIYATDEDGIDQVHVVFRRFNPYIHARFGECWKMTKSYDNPNLGSSATFFLYEREDLSCQVIE